MQQILFEGARELGLTLGTHHLALFEAYYSELASWNQRFNLTAVTGYDEVQRRHFLDSLTCLLAIPHQTDRETIPNSVPVQLGRCALSAVEVGSGAGLPGIPIKIMMPETRMTLVEATGKKVAFLQHVIKTLGLTDIEALHARAEDVGQQPQHRERYDLVVARAVANLSTLCEYCLPLCRVGGRMIAPKGEDAVAEADDAAAAMRALGGRLVAVKQIELASLGPNRYLVVIDKVEKTPERYPRRAGIPSKTPLS